MNFLGRVLGYLILIFQIACTSVPKETANAKRLPASFKEAKNLYQALANFNINKDKNIDSNELMLAWVAMTDEFWRTKAGETSSKYKADFNKDESVNLADIQYWTQLQKKFPGERWRHLEALKLIYEPSSHSIDEAKVKSYKELIAKNENAPVKKNPDLAEIDFNENKKIDTQDATIFAEAAARGNSLWPTISGSVATTAF